MVNAWQIDELSMDFAFDFVSGLSDLVFDFILVIPQITCNHCNWVIVLEICLGEGFALLSLHHSRF